MKNCVNKSSRLFSVLPPYFSIFIIFFLLINSFHLKAQRLNTGFSFEFYNFHYTKFPSDILFPHTNYQAYHISKTQTPGSLDYNFGFNLIVDYNRYFINTRFDIETTTNGIIYKYSYPIGNNSDRTYYSKVFNQQFSYLISFGYALSVKKYFRPYIEFGLGRAMPYFYSEDVSNDKKFSTYWKDRYELRDYLEINKQYNFIFSSFGYKADIFSIYARYSARLGNYDVFYSSLSFGMSVYTKFSKLRKHYIYQPED